LDHGDPNFLKGKTMDIKITYCSIWNYQPRAAGLADKIKQEFGVISELIPGSKGVYDIVVDNKTIYSKDQTKRFPNNDDIIKLLKNFP